MVVMKRYLLIFCCLSSNVCDPMLEDKKEAEKLNFEHNILCRINKKDLPGMIGKEVVYKPRLSSYEKVILGGALLKGTHYQGYLDKEKTKGIVCSIDDLYYLKDNDQ